MLTNHYDLIILGGGCAGLSLAMRLAMQGENAPSTLILEKRAHYLNDRTWCFWDEGSPELRDWVDYAWPSFEVKKGRRQITRDCAQNPYLMLSASSFYAKSLAKIALNPERVTLLNNQSVQNVIELADHSWQITTENAIYTASNVVDTRPNSKTQQTIRDDDATLWQSFIGYEVETSVDIFNPNQFTLMDFDTAFSYGLGFVYVLPTSARHALIEYTVFSANALSADHLKAYIKPALSTYLPEIAYKITRTEFGQLPMGNQKVLLSNKANYIYAGLFAGAARPSSGYAFQRIQRWAAQCSTSLMRKKTLSAPEKDALLLATMDGIFLHVLKSNPKISVSLFFKFFSKCQTKTVIRFLSDHASLADYLTVIAAMPKLPFLKSLPVYLLKQILNRH